MTLHHHFLLNKSIITGVCLSLILVMGCTSQAQSPVNSHLPSVVQPVMDRGTEQTEPEQVNEDGYSTQFLKSIKKSVKSTYNKVKNSTPVKVVTNVVRTEVKDHVKSAINPYVAPVKYLIDKIKDDDKNMNLQNWPNFQLARQIAIGIDSDTYVSDVRGRKTGNNAPDWTEDGCSVPKFEWLSDLYEEEINVRIELEKNVVYADKIKIPHALKKYFDPRTGLFINACRQHDFAYRNLPRFQQGHNEETRKQVDDHFLNQMKKACDEDPGIFLSYPALMICKKMADTYYAAVRVAGQSSYMEHKVIYR